MLYTTQELNTMFEEINEKLDILYERAVSINDEFDEYHTNWQIAMHVAYPNSIPKHEYVEHIKKTVDCRIHLNCILTDTRMYNDQLAAITSMLRKNG